MAMVRSERRREACRREAAAARQAFALGDLEEAFRRLERTHILGQPWAGPHSWAHWMMLRIGWRRRDAREVLGQMLRLAAAGPLSWLSAAPAGNTGGANVPATRPMPVPDDLAPLVNGEQR